MGYTSFNNNDECWLRNITLEDLRSLEIHFRTCELYEYSKCLCLNKTSVESVKLGKTLESSTSISPSC